MSKATKDLITCEYAGRYANLANACVVSVIGLDAISTNKLRGELRSMKISLHVVKNSLARRALADGPLAPLASALEGPCALVVGGESIIDVAKALVELKKKYPAIELKKGILEGDPDLLDIERLSQMKSRGDLLAEIAMLIASPGRRLAGCIRGPGGRLAGCFKAIADKQEGSQ
ncbi:MAG TPA: 50S ribosomal protein L10 [Phycisphaerae bacterium]|nr:50S ribosomal protein L10 [Phycisphaerae bacterium]HRR86789.1 50S ribosomal protein L10 [Phycisphaerae bacterium]